MADGTFAVLLLISGLTDMTLNYCGTEKGCFGRSDVASRVSVSAGDFRDQYAVSNREFYLRYDFGRRVGPFGRTMGLSVANRGEVWLGFGQTYLLHPDGSPIYVEFHAMTGFYENNGGFDLGGPIIFRSGLELGYETIAGWRYSLSYDHRSNAGLYEENPGVETYMFRVSVPFR